MNLYAYVSNNPLRWVDPTRHQITCPEDVPAPQLPHCSQDGGEVRGTMPDPLQPYLPYLVPKLMQERPNPPGPGGGPGQKSVLGEIAETLKAPFTPGPPSCLGIALARAADELTPASPGIADAADMAAAVYAATKVNQALRYAGSTSSRTFGTPFLVYANKSSVYRGLMNQSRRAGLVGLGASATGAIWLGVYDEYQAAAQGLCR
jgi:hypothetical protein